MYIYIYIYTHTHTHRGGDAPRVEHEDVAQDRRLDHQEEANKQHMHQNN